MADSPGEDEFLPIMVGSAIAGMIARIPMHPVDTIKARLQAATGPRLTAAVLGDLANKRAQATIQTASSANVSSRASFFGVLQSTLATEGVIGLYRGFPIAFLGSAPAACLYFSSYEASKRWISVLPVANHVPVPVHHFVAGLAAESVSCVLWVPIDVIKERIQIQTSGLVTSTGAPNYRSAWDAASLILRSEGLRGLYRGYGATLASFGPFSALYFTFYEELKALAIRADGGAGEGQGNSRSPQAQLRLVTGVPLPFHLQVAAASSAGALASFLTSPLDLVKLRLQVQRGVSAAQAGALEPRYQYKGLFDGLLTVWRDEGGRGLWRGSGARVLFHAPSTGISMLLFERCTGWAGAG